LPVSVEQRVELVRLSRSTSLPHRTVVQARGLLLAADGVANQEIARRCGVDSDTVRRWRTRFAEKGVGGVGVGLYLNPPARAVAFSFDERTQCQALDSTRPSLPMKKGRAGTMTHDDKRNATIDLFAAKNIATGQVITDLRKGHAGSDVLRFFKQIDTTVDRGLGVQVVLDNLSASSTPRSPHGWPTGIATAGTFTSPRPPVPG
jgi:Winged helix-turn helix